jgi:chromosome segregation ATPase
MCRKIAIAVGAVLLGLVIVCYTSLPSLVQVKWHDSMAWLDRQVPIETQIKQLKLQASKIDNEIKANIDKLAKMEVEANKLEQTVASLEQDQQKRADEIRAMSNSLQTVPAKFTKSELRSKTNQLELAADTYNVKKEKLRSMKALLEAKKGTLEAAHQKIGDMKDQRDQLFVNIQKLETRKELVDIKTQQSQIVVSDDVLNRCNADVAKISDQLSEVEKQVELYQKYGYSENKSTVPTEKDTKSVEAVLQKAKAVLTDDDK